MDAIRARLVIDHLYWGRTVAEDALLCCGVDRHARYFEDCVAAGMLGMTRAATFWDNSVPFVEFALGYIEEFTYQELRSWVDNSVPVCSPPPDIESETAIRLLEGLRCLDRERHDLLLGWARGEPVASLAERFRMSCQEVCNIRDATIGTLRLLYVKLQEEKGRLSFYA